MLLLTSQMQFVGPRVNNKKMVIAFATCSWKWRHQRQIARENEIMSVCMATKELNSDMFEPTTNDPGQCDSIMQGVRLAIERHMASCPGFANQLRELLVNK